MSTHAPLDTSDFRFQPLRTLGFALIVARAYVYRFKAM